MRLFKGIIAIGFIVIVIIIVAVSYFFGPMFIIDRHNNSLENKNIFSLENDTITLSDKVPQTSLCIYIVISSSDWTDNAIWAPTTYHRVFYTSDDKLICEILKNMKLRVSGRDMATVESKMIIAHNNQVIYATGFVPDGVLGIQNEQYGWCVFIDEATITDLLAQMKPYRWPILYLN